MECTRGGRSPGRAVRSRDGYTSASVFWVPEAARWGSLQAQAKLPEIGVRLAALRAKVKRLLTKYDYPPDKERAIELVLEQAHLFADLSAA